MTPTELHQWQQQFSAFVEQEMAFDAAHDMAHIKRVVAAGIALAEQEGADLAVVLPACWLHDCVAVDKKSPQRHLGSVMSADRAIEYLKSVDYPAQYLDAIHHAIAAHSFSANIATESLAAEVVQDADRLDALGAIGLSRCISLGGAWQSSLYHHADPFVMEREADDKNFSIDHFFVKLGTLPGTMKTAAGRTEADRRWQFMEAFLTQLGGEIGVDYPLEEKRSALSKNNL